ncbi:MAG: CDP-diacylglycerol--glycerol-3-phosphate 3-phosphatidyltransferase [Clostridia bacterium]
MKISDFKNQAFTIPNIITYLRILAVPAIMVLTIVESTYTAVGEYKFPIIALAVMLAAASTDLVDGWFARRFNQVTDLGKLLDPVADKFMHTMTLIALTVIGYVHWAFVVVIVLKEVLMVVGGVVLVKRGTVVQAHMLGKVASVSISVGIVMSYFHKFFYDILPAYPIDWMVLTVGVILTYTAFFSYLKAALAMPKNDGEANKADITEDTAETEKD